MKKRVVAVLFTLLAGLYFLTNQSLAAPWSPVTSLSGWQFYSLPSYLKMNESGDQAAFWLKFEGIAPNTTAQIMACIKYKGKPWGNSVDLTGPMSPIQLYQHFFNDGQIAPDGTAWLAWLTKDDNQPVNKYRVMVAHCPKGENWIIESVSGWELSIRSVDLSIGQNGDVVVAWITSPDSSDYTQGPSSVYARRWTSATGSFRPIYTIATYPSTGCSRIFSMVGATGDIVLIFGTAASAGGSQWYLKTHSYSTGSDTWDASVGDISGLIEPINSNIWYAEPVMDKDGTVVTAWTALTSIGSLHEAQYSSTRDPGTGNWSSPTKISADRGLNTLNIPLLATCNGTAAAVWTEDTTSIISYTEGVFGTARDPGGVWQPSEQISFLLRSISIQDLDIWPTDGTIMVVWEAEDDSRAADEDEGLFWCARTPSNTWGSGGYGQLDTWYDEMKGAGLVLGMDGTATVVYGIIDTKKSTLLPAQIKYVRWPSGGPWQLPGTLADSLALVLVNRVTVKSTTSGQPVSAIWAAIKSITSPDSTAIWQRQMGDYPAGLPAIRNLLLNH